MDIKSILLQLADTPHNAERIDVAVALARAHDAHVIALFTVAPLRSATLGGYPSDGMALAKAIMEQRESTEKAVASWEARFDERMRREGLGSEWRTLTGDRRSIAYVHAHYADVTVMGQPGDAEEGEDIAPGWIEDVILTSGRPVLAVPYAGKFETLGERILIAWNGTREAARAVYDALPILEKAKKTIVFSVNQPQASHIPGTDMCAYLARHGVKAEAQHTIARDIQVGDAILNAAADSVADLIVMGAYGHSRLREFVLGGATRQLLNHMTVPVLMSH